MAPAVLFRAAVALAGRFPALAGVDLVVAPGDVVVLEGPNGAGKTSLLRAGAGLLAVTEGEAVVLGHDLRRDRVGVRRRVGLLGHDAALYDDLTVAENVRFALRSRAGRAGCRSGTAARGADEALERLGLVGRLRDTPAGRLSAGQRRRVALAVLVARGPELWLLDEPHAAFDEGGRLVVDEIVRDAAGEGAAVVLASHEPAMSAPLATRIVSMAGGRVVSEIDLGRRQATGGGAAVDPEAPVRGGVHVA
ncbi:MAG TPA: heme ABC exporter ATP-binding protein CcmA [Acidimicrobiales bacterium]|nr:heme ABC exporter ATP-binding protein CcmA [Acidimicrobiales bacterium]